MQALTEEQLKVTAEYGILKMLFTPFMDVDLKRAFSDDEGSEQLSAEEAFGFYEKMAARLDELGSKMLGDRPSF